MKPRILIVDDHEIVREGIRNLLARSGQEWEICGEASSASEAIAAVKSVPPEVIILDVTMPGISGLEAARLISKLDVPTRALAAVRALRYGAYVPRPLNGVGLSGST